MKLKVILPELVFSKGRVGRNPISHLARRSFAGETLVTGFQSKRTKGWLLEFDNDLPPILVVRSGKAIPEGYTHVLRGDLDEGADENDLSSAKWERHPALESAAASLDQKNRIDSVVRSWEGAFRIIEEDPKAKTIGMRRPQVGALYAILSHWSLGNERATIVMPTGTGKTEVMLATVLHTAQSKTLIVVPTDALREQIADKFRDLGLFRKREYKALAERALYPAVCTLMHKPRDPSEVDAVFAAANVIVTTAQIAGTCHEVVQDRMRALTSLLIVDEAHHAAAPTWRSFLDEFTGKVLQFTATPFREDGAVLEGRIIYEYPLRQAQDDGYFKQIRFVPVVEFDSKNADEVIAKTVVDVLKRDADKPHVAMARVDSIARAGEVLRIYEQYSSFSPVAIHSKLSAQERREIKAAVQAGQHRIVVCVDMLGEGFDMPELKVAAFHDIRKSVPVTIQLVGRFTRARDDLGDATVIANVAEVDIIHELQSMYSQDPDWNQLLPDLAEHLIGREKGLKEFFEHFPAIDGEVPFELIRPATSMVAYSAEEPSWQPDNYASGLPNIDSYEVFVPRINRRENVVAIVMAKQKSLKWAPVESIKNLEWSLLVAAWDPESKMLFINSSENEGTYEKLARALIGGSATLVDSDTVFRSFARVTRLALQNVGLTQLLGRNVRYTGRMGCDVEAALPTGELQRSVKSVLSGTGFRDGERVGVGASRKGRIWSHERGTLYDLVRWCKNIGRDLVDESLDPSAILALTLKPKFVDTPPVSVPIMIDWPEYVFLEAEAMWQVRAEGVEVLIDEAVLELESHEASNLDFLVTLHDKTTKYSFSMGSEDGQSKFEIERLSGPGVEIGRGRKDPDYRQLEAFLSEHPPFYWFGDGSVLEGTLLTSTSIDTPPFAKARIEAWDWSGVELSRESQKEEKRRDTVQGRTIENLVDTGKYDLVFDDDGSNEIADVVAIGPLDGSGNAEELRVEFYHCKYVKESERVGNLYDVCGQAVRSLKWLYSAQKKDDMFVHMLRREQRRTRKSKNSRIELGSEQGIRKLQSISRSCRVSFEIAIVQPSISKKGVSEEELRLLGAADDYLRSTFGVKLRVVGSD